MVGFFYFVRNIFKGKFNGMSILGAILSIYSILYVYNIPIYNMGSTIIHYFMNLTFKPISYFDLSEKMHLLYFYTNLNLPMMYVLVHIIHQ